MITHEIFLAGKYHSLISYTAKDREEGFHNYQAVLWPSTKFATSHLWRFADGALYVVGKEKTYGKWIAWRPETKTTINLGRTLKEAWTTLNLLHL